MSEPFNQIDVQTPPVRRILVVDDDPDINRLLRARLTARGYEVSTAASGEEALALLADTISDIIFLDISLPGINGLQTLAEVRRRGLDAAVIMTTAFGSEQIAVEALRQGANDYLRKPFESDEFRRVLECTVQRLELERQNRVLRQQLEAHHRRLLSEMERAAEVQARLLPQIAPALSGFQLAAECIPARDVGGDFYDWQQPAPHLLSFWLCDVMGKGLDAALLMATVRAVMRAVVRHSPPAEAMRYVTNALIEDLMQSGRFVTLFLAQLDTTSGRLASIDAGHGLAFVRRADGAVETLNDRRGLPLGIVPDEQYDQRETILNPGDALVVYSDGLVDARIDLDLTPHVLADQLYGANSALAMLDRLVTLLAPVQMPPDDMTLLVVYRKTGQG
ncbi:MAG: SpoIIE family protein phosphatase [Roseiflexus sp.]|uniref:PP2C family protein-serine/threonine phosphatase n=1 Tax=Roseiflexus sp. TaxID=2562120 RepID=UPI0025DA6670|nr:SpoIIE family protein phosphatase [Roseiflexus sp.]MCL6541483.1 SpoIIE family protein phosphatase [Roseiflexus sp.]